jgi:hypothetical protein
MDGSIGRATAVPGGRHELVAGSPGGAAGIATVAERFETESAGGHGLTDA